MKPSVDKPSLQQAGFALLRQVIPAEWLPELRAAFDENVKPSDQWPVPRDATWRFSMVDLEPRVQAMCRLPLLLETVGVLIEESFFLSQVEGREPLPGYGHQTLHRDLMMRRPGDSVHAVAFFDDYGPENGATRLVSGTHRPQIGEPEFNFQDESQTMLISGSAGDILVFDSDLVHAGSLNISGKRRRSLLFSYFASPLHDELQATAKLRNVRMDTSDRFTESGVLITP